MFSENKWVSRFIIFIIFAILSYLGAIGYLLIFTESWNIRTLVVTSQYALIIIFLIYAGMSGGSAQISLRNRHTHRIRGMYMGQSAVESLLDDETSKNTSGDNEFFHLLLIALTVFLLNYLILQIL